MRKIKESKILSDSDLSELIKLIAQFMAEGWQLDGVQYCVGNAEIYCQAIVKYEDK